MKLYLGVDGGQSSTRALIGDENGKVIASGEGGPSNHAPASEGRVRLLRAITTAVGTACAAIGKELTEVCFESAFLGFTGGLTNKRPILGEVIRAVHLGLSDDSVIALTGALDGAQGIMTIAGTGSISYGRNEEGATARAGGWGYMFGDEGSGFDLARQGIRAILRAAEGWGEETSLTQRFQQAVGQTDIHELKRSLYGASYSRDQIAAFSTLVDLAARQGDSVAISILHKAAQDLAELSTIVRNRIFARESEVAISYVGGVFRSELVLAEFTRILQSNPHNRVMKPVHPPVYGALLEAYRQLGQTPISLEKKIHTT